MKKKMLTLCGAALLLAAGATTWVSMNSNDDLPPLIWANVEALAQNESGGGGCKWKRIDCKGLWTGDYEACLGSGDGNSCSCGEETRDCD